MERKQDGGAQTPEILREELPMQRFEGQKTSQAVVEGEVALPGGLREETRVLCSEAMAVLEQTDVQPGRVDAEGKVTFHVLYTQGDPTLVSALEASAEFTHSVDFPGAEDGMAAVLSLSVEHVEASAQGGRLHLMAILKAQTRLFSDEPLSVVTGVHGAEGLMLKTETLSCLSAAASGTREVLVREECELADVLQIADTLYATAFATVQDVMGGEEKATVSGNILLEVVHRSQMPSRPVVVTRHTLPFEETVPLLGENGDSLCCDAVVKDVAVLSQEGTGEGERTLRAEVLLGLTVRATASRDVCLMLDAYTTQGDLLEPVTQPVQRALEAPPAAHGGKRQNDAASGRPATGPHAAPGQPAAHCDGCEPFRRQAERGGHDGSHPAVHDGRQRRAPDLPDGGTLPHELHLRAVLSGQFAADPLQYRTDRHHQRPGGGQIHPAPELLRRAAGR